jgi:tripartite-type tricarboxylate transporter receptor subunit TctC
MRKCLLAVLAAAVVSAMSMGRAAAQIQMIVPFPAGGSTDIVARLMQPLLAQDLGAPIVVRNLGGAAGTIGGAEAAKARPDGQTLFLTPTGPIVIQPSFRLNPPFRTESFAPVCQVSDTPVVLMTTPGSGMRTLEDVLARARAERGALPYASVGAGSIPHIVKIALSRAAGVTMNHVPFRGSNDVMLAFQQGTIHLFSDQSVLVRQFNLHPIAVYAEQRMPEYPATPTLRELGYDLVHSIWTGLYVPAGTPEEVVARLDRACERVMQAPAVVEGLTRVAQPILYRGRREFAGFTASEAAKFRALIEAAGIRQAE